MKKILILAVLVVALVAVSSSVALAGGWWVVNSGADTAGWNVNSNGLSWGLDFNDPNGTAAVRAVDFYYRNNGTTSAIASRTSVNGDALSSGTPHGGYSTTTGYCKTCHAVHEAGGDSYRLLKNGEADNSNGDYNYTGNGVDRSAGEGAITGSGIDGAGSVAAADGMGTARSNECMYCHDADSGFSPMRPYNLGVLTTVRGEHTIGAQHVPDADGTQLKNRDPLSNAGDGILQCYQCHSVHGANTMGTSTVGNSKWGEMILRLDPNGDGDNLAGTVVGRGVGVSSNATRTNFCADCHRANPNWDTTALTDASGTGRPRANSHVQGPAADGQLEVYGDTLTVAQSDKALDGTDAATATLADDSSYATRSASDGCRGCHSGDDTGTEQKEIAGIQGTWPHQTIGPKLLNDMLGLTSVYASNVRSDVADTSVAGVVGDADRSLINGDAVCLRCHSANRTGGGAFAVGVTF